MAGIGAPVIHDWEEYYKQFVEANQVNEIFLKPWCLKRGLNYTNTSRKFASIEREQENHRLAKTRAKLAKLAPEAVDTLHRNMGSDDEKVSSGAAVAILDRAGLAPQVATTRITNIQASNSQIVIPPLFAGVYQSNAERMLGGTINIGTGEGASAPDEGVRIIEGVDSGQVDGSGTVTDGPRDGARSKARRKGKNSEDSASSGNG